MHREGVWPHASAKRTTVHQQCCPFCRTHVPGMWAGKSDGSWMGFGGLGPAVVVTGGVVSGALGMGGAMGSAAEAGGEQPNVTATEAKAKGTCSRYISLC